MQLQPAELSQRFQKHRLVKKNLQQMVLENNIHVKTNETRSLSHRVRKLTQLHQNPQCETM